MDEEENEFVSLPDDPEEAFAILEKRRFQQLEENLRADNRQDFYYERQYVNALLAFDEVHDLNYLLEFRSPPSDDAEFSGYFQGFRQYAERTKQKLLVEAARRMKSGASNIVVLDAAARSAIHKFIEAIRDKLNELKLPEGKRESLFDKLNAFAAEVDRNRTRTEAIYALAVETARVAKEVNDEIKPLQETIDRVFDRLDKATKWKDSLPPWSERRKIEAPKKQLPAPDRKPNYDLDDDIPF